MSNKLSVWRAMLLPWSVSLPLLRASVSGATEMEFALMKLAKGKRQSTVATSTPEAETLASVYAAVSREKADVPAPMAVDEGDRMSVDGSGAPKECDVGEELVRYHRGEHEVRDEKERIARAKPRAWCDFCGKHAVSRQCCEGCKIRGVKTYYCDLECQTAAWHMLPKHRCGKEA